MRDLFNGTAQITGTGICFVLIKYYLMSLIKWYNYKISDVTKHLPPAISCHTAAAATITHTDFTKLLLLLLLFYTPLHAHLIE